MAVDHGEEIKNHSSGLNYMTSSFSYIKIELCKKKAWSKIYNIFSIFHTKHLLTVGGVHVLINSRK